MKKKEKEPVLKKKIKGILIVTEKSYQDGGKSRHLEWVGEFTDTMYAMVAEHALGEMKKPRFIIFD